MAFPGLQAMGYENDNIVPPQHVNGDENGFKVEKLNGTSEQQVKSRRALRPKNDKKGLLLSKNITYASYEVMDPSNFGYEICRGIELRRKRVN